MHAKKGRSSYMANKLGTTAVVLCLSSLLARPCLAGDDDKALAEARRASEMADKALAKEEAKAWTGPSPGHKAACDKADRAAALVRRLEKAAKTKNGS